MPPPRPRPHKPLRLVGKQQQPHRVVVLDGTEGDHRTDFRGHLPFQLPLRAKVLRPRHVDTQHDGLLPLLLVHLHVGVVHPGRHVPVNVADVVAHLVGPHLRKLDSASLKGRLVLAPENAFDPAAGAHLQPADLFEELVGNHGGGHVRGHTRRRCGKATSGRRQATLCCSLSPRESFAAPPPHPGSDASRGRGRPARPSLCYCPSPGGEPAAFSSGPAWGSRRRIHVPASSSVSTSMSPLIFSTICLVMERPSPVPSYSRLRPSEACRNGSKTRSTVSSSIPMPVSSTSTTASSSAR